MTKIELYDRNQTDFGHHGYALDDISNDVVTWKLNSQFMLTFDYPMTSSHASDLVAENIVRVPVPGGSAAFRISEVVKSMGLLSITAYHVFWDLIDNFIADTNVVEKDGQAALDQILAGAQYETGFQAQSTIGNIATARLVRMSVINALIGTDDNTFINRWGGEFDWQDFTFSVNPRIGKDRGVRFEYAHNLVGYKATKDSSSIVTRLMPEGYNGLLLPELYVDSPLIGNYRKPKIGTIEYSDIKAIDETQTTGDQEDAVPIADAYKALRAAAAKEFSDNHIDQADWTYELNVAMLENMEEFKGLGVVTTVLPGDTVHINHSQDDINVEARLTGYTWQPSASQYLTQTYDSDSRPDVAYSSVRSELTAIKSQVQLIDKVTIAKTADGKHNLVWSDQSPEDLGLAGKDGDIVYQKTASGTIMWAYHDGKWNNETSDAFGTQIQKEVDEKFGKMNADMVTANANLQIAKQDVADLQVKLKANDETQAQLTKDLAANSNLITQNKADVDAALDTVNDTLSKAQADAATAVKNADLAVTNAQSAVDASGLATQTANAANDAATAAKNLATSTANNFATVQSQAATAASDAATALDQAKSALATANGASGNYTSLKKIVDDTTATVSTLATQTSVDAVKQTVTTTKALAEQTANGLTLKADTTVVDTINNTVKQQAIDIKAAQDQLALTLTASDLTNGLSGYATQSWAQNQITATAKGWEAQLSTVQAQYNDIGQSQGRNYIRNSRFDSGMDFWGSSGAPLTFDVTNASVANRHQPGLHMYGTTTAAYQGIASTVDVKLAKGQKFVIGLLQSFDGVWTQGTLDVGVHFRDKDENILGQQWQKFYQQSGWDKSYNRQSQVYEAPVDCDHLRLMIYVPGIGTVENVYLTEVSLTVGPTSFGWQAAPEDTATYTDTKVASLKLEVDGLTATFAKQSDLSSVSSKLDLTVNGLRTLTEVTGADGRVITNLIDDVHGFQSTVEKVDNLSIGGTNLLTGTADYTDWQRVNPSAFNTTDAEADTKTKIIHYYGTTPFTNVFQGTNHVHLVAGQSYTFSCKAKYYSAKPNGTSVTERISLYSEYTNKNTGGVGLVLTSTLTDTFKRYSVTFTCAKTGDYAGWRVLCNDAAYYSGSLYLAEFKLEQGTVATDWSPAVTDYATAAQYTSITQTVKGIQLTANNAATKASVSLLSTQLTSVIDGGDNRVRKQWFDDGNVGGWPGTVYSSGSEAVIGHKNYLSLKGRDNLEVGNSFSVGAGETYYVDAWLNTRSAKYPVSIGLQVLLRDGSTKWFIAGTLAINQGPSHVSGSVTMPDQAKSAIPWVQINGPVGTDLGNGLMLGMRVTQNAGSSQITQLQDAINLRVTKDGIIGQINMKAGKTLIQNNSIYLDASTVTMGGTAFINAANIKSINAATITSGSISADRLATTKLNADNITSGSIAAARIATTALSATNITSGTLDVGKLTVKNLSADMIASGTIDASKITVKNLSASNIIGGELDAGLVNVKNLNASNIITGTLNAGLVNVIGLNASAISAGTITGANLAINLGTGEVMFQKGSIKSADGHLNIDVNNGTFVQFDGTKGMMFANGNLYLSSSSWWDEVSNPDAAPKPDYGFIGYTDTILTERGFGVIGRDALTLGLTDNGNPGMEYTSSPVITMSRSNVVLDFAGELATIQAGKEFTINTNPYYSVGQTPGIQIGSNVDRSGIGDRVFIDGSYVYIPSAYSRTSSGSANLIVAADGALVRTSSATKYKSNIERFCNSDMGEALLNLPQAHWYNKGDMQRYAEDPQHNKQPLHDFGMIAEDLAAAGLEDLVVRGDDGELEDIRYDRIAPALLPLLAKMKQEIEELKGEKSE